jgi:SAM-dependent methyltransferase
MYRCHLKGQTGDAIHAVLCAAGYNIKWLLRMIRKKGIRLFLSLLQAFGLGRRTNRSGHSNRTYPFAGFKTYTQATAISVEKIADCKYDLVSCTQVLEHVPYPVESVRQMVQVLQPGALFYLEVPLEGLFTERLDGGVAARREKASLARTH